MAKTHTIKRLSADYVISTSNQTWVFAKSVNYTTDNFAVKESNTTDTDIVVRGHLSGLVGVQSLGSNIDITVADGGEVWGSSRAIDAAGVSARIDNRGSIVGIGGGEAINVYGLGSEVYNSGRITSEWNAWCIYTPAHAVKIVNEKGGKIEGGGSVYLDQAGGKTGTLINDGKIISHGTHAIGGGDGEQKIVNRGMIDGTIGLAGGTDLVDTRGGKLTETNVYCGAGNDTFITDNAAYSLREMEGQGYDTIKSTVSYVMSPYSEVEQLILLGKKNINATGASAAETIIGNAGKNAIDGSGGNDRITGGKGNDRLTGGAGQDNFFFRTGSGDDKITDFSTTEDHVYFEHWHGLATYNQILAHSDFKHGDMTITAGHETIVLEGVASDNNIQASMFVFLA